jgi:hypothetical protein
MLNPNFLSAGRFPVPRGGFTPQTETQKMMNGDYPGHLMENVSSLSHTRHLYLRSMSFFKFSNRRSILKSMAVSHFLKSTCVITVTLTNKSDIDLRIWKGRFTPQTETQKMMNGDYPGHLMENVSSLSHLAIQVKFLQLCTSDLCRFSNSQIDVQFSNLWLFLTFSNRRVS